MAAGEIPALKVGGYVRVNRDALLQRAATEFGAMRGEAEPAPTVLVVGEIYVRCVPFANDSAIDRLRSLGVRARLAPMHEWLEYTELMSARKRAWHDIGAHLGRIVRERIVAAACGALSTTKKGASAAAPTKAEVVAFMAQA